MKRAYCIASISPVRSEANDRAEMITQLLFGEVVTIEEEAHPWFKIKTFADNYEGFIDHKHLHYLSEKESNRWLDGITYLTNREMEITTPWGPQIIFKGSFVPFQTDGTFNIGPDHFSFLGAYSHDNRNPFEIAKDYLNSPYLWGGKTPFGIDCSGLSQMVFRFHDINLPRDAYQQADYGMDIDFEDIEDGDLAFFANGAGKIIHVGIVGHENEIIHASGWVRIDELTSQGIVNSTTQQLTHTLHSIKRM